MSLRPSSIFANGSVVIHRQHPLQDTETFQETTFIAQRIRAHLLHCPTSLKDLTLWPLELQIVNHLAGFTSLDTIQLSKENARSALCIAKVCDQVISTYKLQPVTHSSYALRTQILELCSPIMTTAEAYTKTIDTRLMSDRNYLSNPDNWIPERSAYQARLIANLLIKAASQSALLNHRLGQTKPICLAVRAGTAAGKNTAVVNDALFKQALNDEGSLLGELDPDILSFYLKRRSITDSSPFLVAKQVHVESTSLFRAFEEGFKATKASTVILKRLSTCDDIERQVLEPARQRGAEVKLLDIAQRSLVTIFLRVLMRDPFGKDPCPYVSDIVNGHVASFQYRKVLLEKIKKDPLVTYYKLYYDEAGTRQLVAEKDHGVFTVYSQELLALCCKESEKSEIDNAINQVITPELLAEVDSKLTVWQGVSVGKAVAKHALGLPPEVAVEQIQQEALYEEKYGKVIIEPFSTSWLKDFPGLLEHLTCEQLLHVKGTDPDGKGTHWSTGKFSLNELRTMQIRMGYFVVPEYNILEHKAQSMSAEVSQQLKVEGGYRLFVHPAAYSHFQSLHDAGFAWVKPEESEFLWTPTSSERSGVMRKVYADEMSLPFILKLGVPASSSDSSRLLDAISIFTSIGYQREFDSRGKNELLIFRETFGIYPYRIANYPPPSASCDTKERESGLIVREIPQSLLHGECKIFNFCALMSVERLNSVQRRLPLIFDVIEASIVKGCVEDAASFIKKYLIDDYLQAIADLAFRRGLSLALHAQNLCLVLNFDNTPSGFAYRDHEGITEKETLEPYSVLYRYYTFVKLLNVLTRYEEEMMPVPPGAPIQRGQTAALAERSMYFYLSERLEDGSEEKERLKQLSISYEQYMELLSQLDAVFYQHLAHYFDLSEAKINTGKCLPAAESGSIGESLLRDLNRQLWDAHVYKIRKNDNQNQVN